LSGTNHTGTGLDQARAAARAGDTLVVPRLDRLARSVSDARAIADGFVCRGVRLAFETIVYAPGSPMGRMLFNILATIAKFESDLIRLRTCEGIAVARTRGRLCGKKPKLSPAQQEVRRMRDAGEHTRGDMAELFSASRPTLYRRLSRSMPTTPAPGPAWRSRGAPEPIEGHAAIMQPR